MPGGLLTDRGKRATALYYAQHVTHGAFGRGDWADLFNPPSEDFQADALADEFGRAPIDVVRYLIADPAGTVNFQRPDTTIDGPYRYATAPEIAAAALDNLAPSSFVEFQFAVPDNVATGEVIAEIGLLLDAVASAPGWVTPAQVTTPGTLLYLATIPAKTIEPNEEIVRRVAIKA
jgi:hypothetical protein